MTDSQAWWPADWGHYGAVLHPHGVARAGTYRVGDGRGGGGRGQQRFAPLNSWPDNGNLDKARRLLWPIKKKYGEAFVGRSYDSHWQRRDGVDGLPDVWFRRRPRRHLGAGRDHLTGARKTHGSANKRYAASANAGNPRRRADGPHLRQSEGPNGNPDPVASGRDMRETFARMAMNDEETVALVAGGHTFGKAHGAGDATSAKSRKAPVRHWVLAGSRRSERQGRGHNNVRHRRRVEAKPDHLGHGLFRYAVRLRVGADEESGRRTSVEGKGRC